MDLWAQRAFDWKFGSQKWDVEHRGQRKRRGLRRLSRDELGECAEGFTHADVPRVSRVLLSYSIVYAVYI